MAQQMKSALASLGGALLEAHYEHKDDTAVSFDSMGKIPPDVEGVAYIKEMKFGTVDKDGDYKGKPYFYGVAIAVTPEQAYDESGNLVKVAGKRVDMTEMICDTPGRSRQTVSDHMRYIYTILRMAGINTAEFTDDDLAGQIEGAIQVVLSQPQLPCISYRTWKGSPTKEYPNPKVNYNWEGAAEPPEGVVIPGAGTEDGTAGVQAPTPPKPAPLPPKTPAPARATAPATPKAPTPAVPKPATPAVAKPSAPAPAKPAPAAPVAKPGPAPARAAAPAVPKPSAPKPAAAAPKGPPVAPKPSAPKVMPKPTPPPAPEPDPEPQPEGGEGEPIPFDDLAAMADDAAEPDGATVAQANITDLCTQYGITDDEIRACTEGWAQVVALLRERVEGAETPGPEQSTADTGNGDTWHPNVGDVFLYKGIDPKSKKPMSKPIEVEVTAVLQDNSQVFLLSLDDRTTTFKNVPYDKLEQMS